MKKVLTFICAVLLALLPVLSACGFAEAAEDEAKKAELQALLEKGKYYFFASNGTTNDPEAALPYFRKAAEGGLAEAWYYVGYIISKGKDPDRNEKAMECFRKAEELGSPLGLFGQGRLYQFGEGMEADPEKEKALFEAAVAAGCAEANIGLSDLCLEARDPETAIKYTEKALAADEPHLIISNLIEIAAVYANGIGVPQDYEKALEWMMKAAEFGSVEAYNNIGAYYMNGRGVEKNEKEAIAWFEKAAEGGSPANLALCYFYGDGVKKDYKKSMELCLQTLNSGSSGLRSEANEAYWYIATMYRDGLGVKQDFKTSLEWYEKGIEAGDPDCMFAAAQQYMEGWGVEKDPERAIALCEMGAGDTAYGNEQLGQMYLLGRVVDRNVEKAIFYLEKGGKLGSIASYIILGDLYAEGLGLVETNLTKAVEYYEKGVGLGFSIGCSRLGRLYAEKMSPPDYEKAAAWFAKGAEMGSASCLVLIGSCYEKGQGVTADPESAVGYYYKAVEMAGKQNDEDSLKQALSALQKLKRTVDRVSINEKQASVLVGASPELARFQLTCTVTPENALWKDVVWTSSNEEIATVDENGVVSAVAPGKVTITASSAQPRSNKSAKVGVTVGQAVTGIETDPTAITIAVKKTVKVKTTVSPKNANGKKLEWSSENEEIATVNANGQITGKSVGTTTVTVKATDGSEVSAVIQVNVE